MMRFAKGQKVKWFLLGNTYGYGVIVDFMKREGVDCAVMSRGSVVAVERLISDEH